MFDIEYIYEVLAQSVKKRELPKVEEREILRDMKLVLDPIEHIDNIIGLDREILKELRESLANNFSDRSDLNKAGIIQPSFRAARREKKLFKENEKSKLYVETTIKEKKEILDKYAFRGELKNYHNEVTKELYHLTTKQLSFSERSFFEKKKYDREEFTHDLQARLSANEAVYKPKNQSELNQLISQLQSNSSGSRAVIDLSDVQVNANKISIYGARNILFTGIVYNFIFVNNCHNVSFESLYIQISQVSPHPYYYYLPGTVNGIHVIDSSNIAFLWCGFWGVEINNNVVHAIQRGVRQASSSLVIRPIALRVDNSGFVTVHNCHAENCTNFCEILTSHDILCQFNTAHNLIMDMFQCQELNNGNFFYNYRGRVFAYQLHESGRLFYPDGVTERDSKIHSDFIQFSQPAVNQPADFIDISENIVVESNIDACTYAKQVIDANEPESDFKNYLMWLCDHALPLVSTGASVNYGVGVQGMLIQAEAGGKHKRVTLRSNIIHCTQHHPMTVVDVDCNSGLTIENNICVQGVNNNTSSIGPEGTTFALNADCSITTGLAVVANI